MTLDELLKQEAPDSTSDHDMYYREALRDAYATYKGAPRPVLLDRQESFHKISDTMSNSHWRTARLTVLHFMLKGELV